MASDTALDLVRIPFLLWARLMRDLRHRGAGRRESGAFLVGKQYGVVGRVANYLCYDDLDPQALQAGAIAFHASGYAALWRHCREKKVQVLADVHTHPSGDVRQSCIDKRNPMLPVKGHIAMIVPNFARGPWWSLRTVGVHEYLGDFAWRTHDPVGTSPRVRLTLW